MTAFQFLQILLICYGVAWVISSSHLTLGFREWLETNDWFVLLTLLECVGCLGFWEGCAAAVFMPEPIYQAPLLGFAVAASNLLLNSLVTSGENNA